MCCLVSDPQSTQHTLESAVILEDSNFSSGQRITFKHCADPHTRMTCKQGGRTQHAAVRHHHTAAHCLTCRLDIAEQPRPHAKDDSAAQATAPALQALVDAGARVVGTTTTQELYLG